MNGIGCSDRTNWLFAWQFHWTATNELAKVENLHLFSSSRLHVVVRGALLHGLPFLVWCFYLMLSTHDYWRLRALELLWILLCQVSMTRECLALEWWGGLKRKVAWICGYSSWLMPLLSKSQALRRSSVPWLSELLLIRQMVFPLICLLEPKVGLVLFLISLWCTLTSVWGLEFGI